MSVCRGLPPAVGDVAISMVGDGARWCMQAGRMHRSNKVWWLVRLGTTHNTMRQRCFDPECRGEGPTEDLPPDLGRTTEQLLDLHLGRSQKG